MGIRLCVLSVFLIFCILFSLAVPVAAGEADDIQRQLLQYYLHHQDHAETDILRLLEQLKAIEPELAEAWAAILAAWSSACNDLVVNSGVLPDGLPEDDSLCIMVMGFALNYNGSMSKELQGRLDAALASAKKYPNAYILCAGGGTAGGNQAVTEAGQMAAWLREQGIAESRIIIENKSYSTEQNVRNSMRILRESYPQVSKLAVVSSDYHIRRCHWLFQAEIILTGTESTYQVVSNGAYEAGYVGESGFWSEAESLGNLLKIYPRPTPAPALSQLTEIKVSGEQTYFCGESPDLMVTAFYDSGFSRDVTRKAEIRGFDSSAPNDIQIEIIYSENGRTQSIQLPVTILSLPTEATVSPQTEPADSDVAEPSQEPDSVPVTPVKKPSNIPYPVIWISCSIVAAISLIHCIPKKQKRGKYQK